jgi:hypothetical protein
MVLAVKDGDIHLVFAELPGCIQAAKATPNYHHLRPASCHHNYLLL